MQCFVVYFLLSFQSYYVQNWEIDLRLMGRFVLFGAVLGALFESGVALSAVIWEQRDLYSYRIAIQCLLFANIRK